MKVNIIENGAIDRGPDRDDPAMKRRLIVEFVPENGRDHEILDGIRASSPEKLAVGDGHTDEDGRGHSLQFGGPFD